MTIDMEMLNEPATTEWLRRTQGWLGNAADDNLRRIGKYADVYLLWTPRYRCIEIGGPNSVATIPVLHCPTKAEVIALSTLMKLRPVTSVGSEGVQ